jgi:hypothetical protein
MKKHLESYPVWNHQNADFPIIDIFTSDRKIVYLERQLFEYMKSQELLNYEIAVIGIPLIPIENQPEFSEKNYRREFNSAMLLMGYNTSFGTNPHFFSYLTSCKINIGKEFLVVVNTVNDNIFTHRVSNICNYLGQNSFYHINKETRGVSMINHNEIEDGINTIDIFPIHATINELEYHEKFNDPSPIFESFRSLQFFSKYIVTRIGRPILKELNIIAFHK